MKESIKIRNLKKYYWLFEKDFKIIKWIFTKKGYSNIKKALDGINLTIKQGETVGIIGANGAGKSTLMKLVAGITFPTEGTIEVNGKVGSLINLNAGFVPDYTGRENIYYKAKLLGMTNADIDLIINDIINFVDIGEYFDMPMKTYSTGMGARLGFALAVYMEPDILIVDEVFAVGDKEFREKSKAKMKELFTSGKSIIFSSHSENLIKQFCDRVVYIRDGKIIFDGSVSRGLEIYNNYRK